jgi:DNA-binding beta-propeller fold protein YncE/ABC-type branched-subunit amino acid transport system substrate-binding protein
MARNDAPGGRGSPEAAELAAGTAFGNYRIELPIGRGGMGVVYRAHDGALDRDLALKLLAPELAADESFRARFLRESRLAASLDHPSIVPIFDAGEVDGQLYIAMRLVDGTDLKRLLAAEGPLDPERAVRMLEQVADALDTAHERGLVHRDVKPSNVLIDARGHVYLADFGLSRRLAEQSPLPGAGLSLGTADYVAPEQIRGEHLDGRADLYSLGCLLFECLAGAPPFARSSDTAVVFAHLQDDPPALPGLERVVAKALAKHPDERYQSGHELIAAARQALGLAQPRRSRWPLAAAAVGVALIGAVLLGFFMTRGGGTVPAEPGASSLLRIDPETNTVISSLPVGRQASGVAAAGRYVWVTSLAGGTVWRIDAESQAMLKIPVRGSPTGVAAGHGTVLVANGPEHGLASVDASTGAVGYTKPLGGDPIGSVPVASGPAGVWFADASEGVAAQLAEATRGGGALHDQIRVPADRTNFLSAYESFDGLAVGEHAIWAAGDTFDRTLWRLDPVSRRVVASIELPFVPGSVAVGAGAVWVASLLDDAVLRIDPGTNHIVKRISVPRGVVGLAAGAGAVWVASSIDRTVSRIDPRTNRIAARVKTSGIPTHVAVGARDVWVTTAPPAPPVPHGTIAIGVLADCVGPYGTWYDTSVAGAELVLLQHGAKRSGPGIGDGVEGARIAGKPVMLVLGCTDRTATSALSEARRLVEQVGVRILIAPTYASEELALQQFARRHPEVAFVDGAASAQVLRPPANWFAFNVDGAEFMAGAGAYAYRTLGWRHAVVVADLADRVFNWTQSAGFIAEFCSLGGTIERRVWVPAGTADYSAVIAQIPRSGVDGIFAATTSHTVVALSRGYAGLRGNVARKLVIGAIANDPELGTMGDRLSNLLWSGPWLAPPEVGAKRAYLADLGRRFARFRGQDNCCAGSAFDVSYHDAMAATAQALAVVDGDLSGSARRFMQALARVRLDSPTGAIRLDSSHEATGPNYVQHIAGTPYLRRIEAVEHTFGGYFKPGDPPPSTTTPACVKRTPPPWAR